MAVLSPARRASASDYLVRHPLCDGALQLAKPFRKNLWFFSYLDFWAQTPLIMTRMGYEPSPKPAVFYGMDLPGT